MFVFAGASKHVKPTALSRHRPSVTNSSGDVRDARRVKGVHGMKVKRNEG